jgi:hypothetical protein
MNRRITPVIENVAEATAACLITMAQGNILAFTVSHWIIASQTGIAAGVLASAAVFIARTDNRWVIAAILGLATGFVDYLVHPGMFRLVFAEAAVTGIGAAALSYIVGIAWRRLRLGRAVAESRRPSAIPDTHQY